MRFKVKNFSIITALVLALSLSFSVLSFGATLAEYVTDAPTIPISSIEGSGLKDGSEAVGDMGTVSFSSYPALYSKADVAGFTDGIFLTINFANAENSRPQGGWTVVADFHLAINQNDRIDNIYATFGKLGTDYNLRQRMQWNGTITHSIRPSDGVHMCYIDGQMTFTIPEWGYVPQIMLTVETDTYSWVYFQLRGVYLLSPESQLTDGWNGSNLDNSGQQLGGALGELDDMQASADSDLHDAIADMTQPDLDEQSTGISFMTSSISMLWGALGGFQAVILCALALVVFNFISRYRGS